MPRLLSTGSIRFIAAFLALGFVGLGTPSAFGQGTSNAQNPIHSSVDENGVDLISGRVVASSPVLSIGTLSYSQIIIGEQWRHNPFGTIHISGSTYIVSLGGGAESFTKSGSTYTSDQQSGSSLSYSSGIFTYTLSDGTVATFDESMVAYSPYYANGAYLTGIVAPNGHTTSFHYSVAPISDLVGGVLQYLGDVYRLQAITNSDGYQIQFDYYTAFATRPYQLPGYFQMVAAYAINQTEEQCPTVSDGCSGLDAHWPRLTMSHSGGQHIFTTEGGLETRLIYSGSQLTGIRYPGTSSNDITYAYSSGRVSSVTDAGSNTWSYSYGDVGSTRTTTVTNPLSQTVSAVSNLSTGTLTSFTNGTSNTTSYSYDSYQRLTRVTAPEGNYVNYTYDTNGNVTEIRQVEKPGTPDLADIVQTFTYGNVGSCSTLPRICNLPTASTGPNGQTTNYVWSSAHGGPTSISAPAPTAGAARPEVRYSYATYHARFIDPNSGSTVDGPNVYQLTGTQSCAEDDIYGTGGQPDCRGTAYETVTELEYEDSTSLNNRRVLSQTVRSGTSSISATSSYTWNRYGDPVTVDGPFAGTGDTTMYRYDGTHRRRLVGIIGPDPDGGGALLHRAVRYSYDTRARVWRTERGTATAQSDTGWSNFSQIDHTDITFDTLSRPTHQRFIASGTTHSLVQVGYDALSRAECVTTRMNPTTFASPPSNACTLASAGSFGPDRVTRYTYDAAGRTATVTTGYNFAPLTTSFSYWANGQLATVDDPGGSRMLYSFDRFDRPQFIVYPDPSTPNTSNFSDYEYFAYDAAGRLFAAYNRSGNATVYLYDDMSRVRKLNFPGTAPDVEYTYDNFSRVTSAFLTGGSHTNTYAYDALGRLTSETTPLGTQSYSYDLTNRRRSLTYAGGTALTVQYDLDWVGAVTSITENGSTSLATYAYDNLGRRSSLTRGNGVITSYSYDGASRLSSLSHALAGSSHDVSFGFSYNPAGQITSRTSNNDVYAFTGFTNQNVIDTINGRNQVTATGATSVSHDARGNITAVGSDSYGYDEINRLVSAPSTTLTYDPSGRLYQSAGSTTVRYAYDGASPSAEYDGSSNLQRRYVYGPGLDEPLVRYEGTGLSDRRWYVADERGSVLAETGGTGYANYVNRYGAYGEPAPSNSGRFGYTGHVWLADAELNHARNRAYNPDLGRFMQTDPIGQNGGTNIYGYVGGDPMNFTDPWGLARTTYDRCVDTGITKPRKRGGSTQVFVCWNLPPSVGGSTSWGGGGGIRVGGSGGRSSQSHGKSGPQTCVSLPIEISPHASQIPYVETRLTPITSHELLWSVERIVGENGFVETLNIPGGAGEWTMAPRGGGYIWRPNTMAPGSGTHIRFQPAGTGSAHPDSRFAGQYPGGYYVPHDSLGRPININDGLWRSRNDPAVHHPVNEYCEPILVGE